MNFSFLLLAFFLVAVLLGTLKALKKGMRESLLQLGTVVVAYLLTLLLQAVGVMRAIAGAIAGAIDLSLGIEGAQTLATSLIATVIAAFFFVIFFLILLLLLRLVALHFVRKLFEKKAPEKTPEKASENVTEQAAEAAPEGTAEKSEEKSEENDGDTSEKKPEKKKKEEKPFPFKESAGRRVASVSSGIVGGILLLGVLLMPIFYLMSLVTTVTHATDGLDAEDSRVYQAVEVLDTYVADPYESSFVGGFYDVLAISDVMTYTAKLGGKITMEDGTKVYADDVAKTLLSHGVSAATQITSAESACPKIREDMDALLTNPMLSSVLADGIADYLSGIEMEEPTEDDLKSGIVYTLVHHYKEADIAAVRNELPAFGHAISLLAEKRVLPRLLGENANFEKVLRDEEALDIIVEAITELSAYGPTVEATFEVSVDIMCETLKIPENHEEAYDHFVDDLLTQMKRDSDVVFDINTIRYYIVNCEQQGKKVSAANGIKGHGQFMEYLAHWKKVQTAFAHASEDQSYGYFTIEINSEKYVYDAARKTILVYNALTEAEYKDKISPLSGIINALTLRSTQSVMTRENLYAILSAYAASANDPESVALARRMLSPETFVSRAVTMENMHAAASFEDWTAEEKVADGKLCVDIVLELMTLMDDLADAEKLEGKDAALDMLNEFKLLGETMDTMKKTTCLNGLPPLLIEGIMKNELFAGYVKPAAAFQINNIVANSDKTYTEAMVQIEDVLRWAIHSLGDLSEVK